MHVARKKFNKYFINIKVFCRFYQAFQQLDLKNARLNTMNVRNLVSDQSVQSLTSILKVSIEQLHRPIWRIIVIFVVKLLIQKVA